MGRSDAIMEKLVTIDLQATDVSGQHCAEAKSVPADASVGELISGLLSKMQLPRNDINGRPLNYQARLDREGRHLHTSERVGDSLQTNDRIVLTPNVDAGCGQS